MRTSDSEKHLHQCPGCETVWEHSRDDILRNQPEDALAHSCPACGQEQRFIYDGPEQPVAFRAGHAILWYDKQLEGESYIWQAPEVSDIWSI